MKKILIVFLLGCFLIPSYVGVKADDIVFEYDASGNCIVKRKTIVLKNKQDAPDLPAPEQELETEQWNNRELIIYPNPTRGMLQIEFKGLQADESYELLLAGISGKQLYQTKAAGPLCTLDMTAYPAGTYILTIINGGEKKEWKIIKE